jgi:hypothetical protein
MVQDWVPEVGRAAELEQATGQQEAKVHMLSNK